MSGPGWVFLMPRVLINCPVKSRAIPTGYWMNPAQLAGAGARYAFRCSACNEIHQWERGEAWLEGDAPRVAKAPANDALAAQALAGGAG